MYKEKKIIGICSTYLDQKFHMKLIDRMIKELTNRDLQVMIFGMGSDLFFGNSRDEGEMAICDLIPYDLLDGLIIFPETIKQDSVVDNMVERANKAGVFVVAVEKKWKNCYNVVYDIDSAFEELVRHVIEYHRLREVNFIAGIEGNPVSENRLKIYKKVLEDNDILFEDERVGYGNFWEGPTRKVMDDFMDKRKVPPEAIICANDSMAIAVCDYLKEHHVKVPEDIIVTGIDGIEEGVKHSPGITTCVRHEVSDAKKIVEMISDLLEGKRISDTLELSYRMRLSQSCGCQKHHLYDSVAVISKLTNTVATNIADLRYYAQMTEDFLRCDSINAFEELEANYLPDNSFLCINSDLQIDGEGKNNHRSGKNAFTEAMQAVIKKKGNATYSECLTKDVIPDIECFVKEQMPVIMWPVHFSDRVVGYFGIWYDFEQKIDLLRILRFLFQFDNSAALRLTQK